MPPSAGRSEVGQPDWLPDFVDPADVRSASFEASRHWGQEGQPDLREDKNEGQERSQWQGSAPSGGAARRPLKKPQTAGRPRKPKKRISWAEKQQRSQERAEKRREEEAKQRQRDPMAFAREIVLTHLTSAPRSRAQLADRLRAKEVDEATIEAVLDRMEDVGLVDDSAFAHMLVRSQLAARGLARRGLAQELQRKGIGPEAAQEALDQVDDADERSRAMELARKKMSSMNRLDRETQTRRLAGMLARKGYPASLVWSVIKEVQGSFDSDEAP